MPCNHWDGLTSFLDGRRILLDTNIVERGIRPIVLECKNALFAAVTRGRRTGRARPTRGPTSPTCSPGSSISGLASRLDELMPWGVARRSDHSHAAGSQKRICRCQLCAAIRARDGSNSGLRDTLRNRSAIGGQAEVICSRRAFPILTRTGKAKGSRLRQLRVWESACNQLTIGQRP